MGCWVIGFGIDGFDEGSGLFGSIGWQFVLDDVMFEFGVQFGECGFVGGKFLVLVGFQVIVFFMVVLVSVDLVWDYEWFVFSV